MREFVVRHEHFGPLIWSDRKKAFFICTTDSDRKLVNQAIERKRAGYDWRQVAPPELLEDLEVLGFDDTMREIQSPYTDRLSAPLESYFDYTWVCNLANAKCGRESHCYASDFLGTTTMAPENVRNVLYQLRNMGVMRLHLAGGESTVDAGALANYLNTANELGLYTSMATNGLLFSERICDIILANNLKSVSFSLDGHTEETHAAVRGGGLFKKTIEGIRRFKKLRDELNSPTMICLKPTYDVNTSFEVLRGIVEIGLELGMDLVKFSNPERCLHHLQGHYGQHVEEYYRYAFYCKELQEEFKDKIAISVVNNPLVGCETIGIPGMKGCIGAQELITINPDGTITPCLMHPKPLGNILTEYESLEMFWRTSNQLVSFWNELETPGKCKTCTMHHRCRSGSVTRRVVEVGQHTRISGQFTGVVDPLCPADYIEKYAPATQWMEPPPKTLNRLHQVCVGHSL